MARIRTIKPEFFTSSDIGSLTPLSRLFYVALWCESDREGRLNWNSKTFKARYFPYDGCDIEAMANELINAGLITIYTVDYKQYCDIPSFKNHQMINNRESESILPSRVKVASPRVQAEGRKEGKERKEGKSRKGFDLFWSAYPKKAGKADAEKSWDKINPDADLQNRILTAVSQASKNPDWIKEGGQFIPHAATWLNGKRWEDSLPVQLIEKSQYKNGDKLPNGMTWFNGRAMA